MNVLSRNKVSVLLFTLAAVLGAAAIAQTRGESGIQTETAQGQGELASISEATQAQQQQSARIVIQPGMPRQQPQQPQSAARSSAPTALITHPADGSVVAILKDVGEAAFDHFGLKESDFLAINRAGFDVIEGNFDICADDKDVAFFLEGAQDAGLRVILNAGAGEAEWGYPCSGDFDPAMKPTWQRAKVEAWVEKWKHHPAVYAWDISNEDGGTFPFGTGGVEPDPDWETKYALSLEQLQQAYRDVKSLDTSHPVMIRMNGWYFYDYPDNFFRAGNAFGKDVADIVMVNAYSNVGEYISDFVSTVFLRATRAMYAIDPHVRVIPALGVWEEPPIWVKPTPAQLTNDFNQARKAENLVGVAFFKYGAAEGRDWYLPDEGRGDPELWRTIQELIR